MLVTRICPQKYLNLLRMPFGGLAFVSAMSTAIGLTLASTSTENRFRLHQSDKSKVGIMVKCQVCLSSGTDVYPHIPILRPHAVRTR